MSSTIRSRTLAGLVGLLLTLGTSSLTAQRAEAADTLARVIDGLRARGTVAGESIRARALILGLHHTLGLASLWTAADARAALRRATLGAYRDGLEPTAYHLRVIDSLEATRASVGSRTAAELDVLRTSALAGLVHDLRWGRARPASSPSPEPAEEAALLRRIASSPDLVAAIDGLRPDHFAYEGLAAGLNRLRNSERAGGWGSIPQGPPLREGEPDPRVVLLRIRLAAEGYLASDLPPTADFDAELTQVVRSFQHHHGLNEDGVVGATTLAELNVPVGERISQVRVNLERARWVTPELPDTFLVVNIAGAKLHLVRGGSVVHEARVIVGREYTRTPIFESRITQVELNPSWTVPASIVDEVLAKLRADPDYLSKQGFRVLDGSGREAGVTASDLLARSGPFPWVLRQDPGPLNSLGRIKVTFPNPYSVYLHDTPSRGLFEREARLFSHGCIRVQDPLALAELLIDQPERWSRGSLQSAIDAGSREAIPLKRPVFILLQYWTASADERGELHFYRDVYGRDAAVRAALQR